MPHGGSRVNWGGYGSDVQGESMKLSFDTDLAAHLANASQKARILSEDWVRRQVYCPSCGQQPIVQRPNNSRVSDFQCSACQEEYEVKSLSKPFRDKVEDGEYHTMLRRLGSSQNPNFLLLHYDRSDYSVRNAIVVPKHFFVPQLIEARKPLSPNARRAGWTGCRILLRDIPKTGQIHLIEDRIAVPKEQVLTSWARTLFLRDRANAANKGWLLAVMKCIEKIGQPVFGIAAVYAHEGHLRDTYPGNRHIREKIRQQLQVLRDRGYLEFVGRGLYRPVSATPAKVPAQGETRT